jgi:non-heme chloroperoxidase
MDTSPHKSDFVNVNGVRLHYLDWGGSGEVLLFLAGMGCNAHIFDQFAPRFTDKFHVMAVTRRGHGESDHPETGYDIETLTEDLRQFMDALGLDQAILAGHSLAHIELSHFSALYPERILKLIFLDAAYDRTADSYKNMVARNPLHQIQPPDQGQDYYSVEAYFASIKSSYPAMAAIWSEFLEEQGRHEITQTAEGKVIDKMTETIEKAIRSTFTSYHPEDAKLKCPTLGIFAISSGRDYLAEDWMTAEQKAQVLEFFATINGAWAGENIEQFRQNVPQAQVVVIPEGHHYCFIKQEEQVYEAMRKFLVG